MYSILKPLNNNIIAFYLYILSCNKEKEYSLYLFFSKSMIHMNKDFHFVKMKVSVYLHQMEISALIDKMRCWKMNQLKEQQIMKEMLSQTKTIAVIGLSDKEYRTSFQIAKAMQQVGYRIIPVNPHVKEVLGEKAYASIADVE